MADVVAFDAKSNEGDTLVVAQEAGGVLRLTLNAPPANALSRAMMRELAGALEAAAASASVRVVVISAAGTSIFSAGHDLAEIDAHRADADEGRAFFEEVVGGCADLMQAIVMHEKPVIAEVNGLATAAGCQLVASCDLAVCTDRATFCTPGVNIGLFCSMPMVALSRTVARKQAMEMLLTGETIDAGTAKEFGLVNRVVPNEYLRTVVDKYAASIAAKSAHAVRVGKQAFYRQAEMSQKEAYADAARVMVENMMADDAREGIAAFLDQRVPRWPRA
ncbi:enoyl-CoA hydratase [Pararhizobium mangrovi]|uniref:Enoyl-CoA hydratase domain-containing protein 3, mitochondrial n=1 Tax=Pararhizobium mangrovi TaxID=2590452 RepID=A0A506TZW6_9HYPH|nr:enoyl-CoA hydratase [Pararhizobium mangrovi]TPW25869.1 enoyl-CoA hydratase [Pararhizobium mangrovi]